MKALICEQYSQPPVLTLNDVAPPEVAPGTIRIKVACAGVNFPDTLMVEGRYQVKPPLPFTPGSEAAGTIEGIGEGVTGFAIGDRVMAMEYHGALGELMVANAGNVVPLPEAMPFDVAAGFTTNYATSYYALKQRAELRPGQTVLVLGAGGGVGITAVELAKLMGARVIAAASTDEKLALCREYGADEVINYSEEDLREGIRRTTAGAGPDVIYDPVGGRYAEPAFRSIGWGGKYLVVGFAAGEIPRLPFNLPLIKGASIVGVICGIFRDKEPEAYQQNLQELLEFYVRGQLRPHVSKRFTLERSADAIAWIAAGKAQGKIIVEVG